MTGTEFASRTEVSVPVMLAHGPAALDVVLDVPADATPLAPRVLLMHGFARGPRVLDELVDDLVAAGCRVARPHIRSFKRRGGMTDPEFLAAAAESAIGVLEGQGPVIVMGHSAGGAGAAHAAAHLLACGVAVRGVVLVDPNESLTPMLVPALDVLAALDRQALRLAVAEPGRCNRQGLGPRMIAEHGASFVGVRMVKGTHCEIEGAAADIVCRRVCGGASDPVRSARLRGLLTAWVSGIAAADDRGLPGHPIFDDLVAQGHARALDGSL